MRSLMRIPVTIFLIIAVLWTETKLRQFRSTKSLWRGGRTGLPPVLYGPTNGSNDPNPNLTVTYPTSGFIKSRKRPALTDLIPDQYMVERQTQYPIYEYEIEDTIEPEPRQIDGVIVVGKLTTEDTDWVVNELPEWQNAIYTVDDPKAPLTVQQNKGKESSVYLQYLLDNYSSLPSTIVFLHSHRDGFPTAWHDHSNVRAIQNLQLDFVQQNGYANLRCNPNPGCPDEVLPFRQPPDPIKLAEVAFPDAWRALFNGTTIPDIVAVPCCAQFAVSRAQVWQRPLSSYEWYHRWLMETDLPDEVSGRVMEYLWHIIFGRDPV